MVDFRVRPTLGQKPRAPLLVFDRMERKVMEQLWKGEPLVLKEIASRLRISHHQANVVLSRLGSRGLVSGKSIRAGNRGRPSRAYCATVSKKEFGDRLANELRFAVLDIDARVGLSRERVQSFTTALKTMHE